MLVFSTCALMEERNALMVILAKEGCTSKEIKGLLEQYIDVRLSLRQIQRVLKKYKLNKRGDESPLHDIELAILKELKGPGELLGYRGMCGRLRNVHNLAVKRSTVMILLALLDPKGTAQRKSRKLNRRVYRSKGPNYVWHCDGMDKLKPYGLPIHACIDGYSRRILWMKVADSTSNPKYIAHYYLDCVKSLGGCPRVLRSDMGSENSNIAFLQPMLRHGHSDIFSGSNSHRYGKSTSNQRIEAFWSQLRRHHIEWWINFFKDMIFKGHFNPSIPFHVDTARYAFGNLIQQELDNFVNEWNNHYIRKSSMAETPHGIPNVLFKFPELHGARDYICPVNTQNIYFLRSYSKVPSIVATPYKNLADALTEQYNLPMPSKFSNALELYFQLVYLIDEYF